MKKDIPVLLLPLLMLAGLALLAGLLGGLARLGWALPNLGRLAPAASQHGPLMVSGFLGTLISLERVAALRRGWMFAAPGLTGAGWLLSLILPHLPVGAFLITAGSLVTAAILGVIYRRESKIYTSVMAVGALCWLAGNLLWITVAPVARVVWLWAAFLVLTIAGERLELNRVLRLTARHYLLFLLAVAPFLLGALLYTLLPQPAARLSGAGMLGLAAWMLGYDIARRNLRHPYPLTRFIAACLFAGYFWLGFSGLLNIVYGAQVAGPIYDALLHTLFVGFVFSMIFGHAPIILPALTRITVSFHPSLYLPLFLLHLSLIARVAGSLGGLAELRRWGGLLNEAAVLMFIGLFAFSVIRGRSANKQPAPIREQAAE